MAVNKLTIIPIVRVRAKPLIKLVPNQNSTSAEMMLERLESRIASQAWAKPARIAS